MRQIVFTPTRYSADYLLKGMTSPESLKFVCALSLFLDIVIGYRIRYRCRQQGCTEKLRHQEASVYEISLPE